MTPIPQRMLIVSEPFGPRMDAERVARQIARGVEVAGRPAPDLCPIVPEDGAAGGASAELTGEDVRAFLDELGFDARMRAARAVVIAARRLAESALAGSLTFEIATRARQGGVPAYAVTAEGEPNAFDARILDLQLILRARSVRTLVAAGERLGQIA